MPKAIWNNTVLAESDRYELVEGNVYFPPESIHREFFQPGNKCTFCHWKGTASYFDVSVAGKTNPNAAWYYPAPEPAASHIKDFVAFWNGVEVTVDPTA